MITKAIMIIHNRARERERERESVLQQLLKLHSQPELLLSWRDD